MNKKNKCFSTVLLVTAPGSVPPTAALPDPPAGPWTDSTTPRGGTASTAAALPIPATPGTTAVAAVVAAIAASRPPPAFWRAVGPAFSG